MSVISLSFLLFLSATLLLYFLAPRRVRTWVLLAASLLFYLSFRPALLLFPLLTTLAVYGAGLALARAKGTAARRALLAGVVVLVLGTLFAVKFLDYALGIFGRIFLVSAPSFSLPVACGISFYSMQAVSYAIDVYRGKYAPEKNPARLLLYMIFFPTVLQGPICRYDKLSETLFVPHGFDFERFKSGGALLLWGLFKKLVIADRAAVLVGQVFGAHEEYAGVSVALAVLCYTLQIYTDFSGFTDISRGICEILGIRLAQNFDHPYFSLSIQEFWRRWHISLSSWFRDYLYFPLGGSRKGTARKYLNLTLVFFASGLWHGVGLQFMVWGMLQAVFQIFSALITPVRERLHTLCHTNREAFSYRLGKWCVTFFFINLSWLFFRAESVSAALSMARSLLSFDPWSLTDGTLATLGLGTFDLLLLLAGTVLLLLVSLRQRTGSVRAWVFSQGVVLRYAIYLVGLFSVLVFGMYGAGYDESQFLYMQF